MKDIKGKKLGRKGSKLKNSLKKIKRKWVITDYEKVLTTKEKKRRLLKIKDQEKLTKILYNDKAFSKEMKEIFNTCSVCKHYNKATTDEFWECSNCGSVLNRIWNAARNILSSR